METGSRIQGCVHKNEISMSGCLDGNAIKSVASGGDQFKGRTNFKDPIKIKNRAQIWMFLNDVPKIKPYDEAIDQRLECFEYKIVFKPKPDPENPLEKLQDENIKDLFEEKKYQYALIDIIREGYQKYQSEGFLEVEAMTNAKRDWLQSENALLFNLIDGFDITRNDEDYVLFKDIKEFVKNKKMNISPKKLGDEMSALGLKSKNNWISSKSKTEACRLGIRHKVDNLT